MLQDLLDHPRHDVLAYLERAHADVLAKQWFGVVFVVQLCSGGVCHTALVLSIVLVWVGH